MRGFGMKRWPIALALVFLAFVGWWLHQPRALSDDSGVAVAPRPVLPWKSAPSGVGGATVDGAPARHATGSGRSPLEDVAPPVFRLTPQGQLMVDEQTRSDIERVASLHGRDEALARLDEATRSLGEAARRDVRALYEQLVRYEQALVTALAGESEHAPGIADARRQLQLMRELRAQHFGERAGDLFGAEEAMQQRLLDDAEEAMRTRGLSLEEAIGQAQARLGREGREAAPQP